MTGVTGVTYGACGNRPLTSPRSPPPCLALRRPHRRAGPRRLTVAVALAAATAALRSAGQRPPGPRVDLPRPRRSPRRVGARNPVTPGNFTGLGFDQCHAPEQSKMDAWLAGLAVPRGRHLHLRRLARLPRPAQPHAHLDQHPAGQRAGGCCRSRSARRRRATRVPALRQRPGDQHQAQRGGRLREGVQAGHRRGDRPRSPRPRRSASCPAARSGTTSRGTTSPTPPAASRRCGSSARGPSSCTRSATSPASTPAPARASRCSTTPGCCGRASSRCPTRSGSRAGTARPTPRRPTSAPTAGCPGRRVKQFQGGHDETWGGVTINIDRNYLDLGSAAPPPPGRGEPLPRHPGRPGQLPAAQGAGQGQDARPGPGDRAQVPAQGAGRLPRQGQGRLDAAG